MRVVLGTELSSETDQATAESNAKPAAVPVLRGVAFSSYSVVPRASKLTQGLPYTCPVRLISDQSVHSPDTGDR